MSTLKVNGIQAVSGTADAISLTASDKTCTANITNNLSNRNLIINGAMQVNQRGSTAGLDDFNVVTGNLYTLDRWEGVGTSSFDWDSARIKQVSDSPDEFSNSLRVDIGNTETPGAGQNGLVRTKIEAQDLQHLAYGTSSAKTCTLSFWVRSNKTGTYCVQIQQRDADKHLLYEYSISSANTWEKKTITFSGNTSDAITNDNGIGFQISFHLACHSDDHESATTSWAANSGGAHKATSNQVNLWDHADNVWYLTGVQLEVSDYATDFEHRSYSYELKRSQRYYRLIANNNGGTATETFATGACNDTGGLHTVHTFDPEMRSKPSAEITTGTNYFGIINDNSLDYSSSAPNAVSSRSSARHYEILWPATVTQNAAGFIYTNNNSAKFAFSAEL